MKYVMLLLMSSNVFGMNKALNSRRMERIIQEQTEMRRKNKAKDHTQITITHYSDTFMDQKTITTDKHIIIVDNNNEKITVFDNTFSHTNEEAHFILARTHEYYISFLTMLENISFVQEQVRELKSLKTRSWVCACAALKPLDTMIQLLRCYAIIQSISGK